MGIAPLFLFGTLRDRELLELVAGGPVTGQAAVLPAHRVARAEGEVFPLLVGQDGASAEGLLLTNVSADQLARLDYYEAPYGYTRVAGEVELPEGEVVACDIYRPTQASLTPGADWSLTDWQAADGALSRETAREVMEGFPDMPAERLAALWPVMRVRAQQRVHAAQECVQVRLRQPHSPDDVRLVSRARPYSNFFSVEEVELEVAQFDGAPQRMSRAVFMMADAVTVLPYDPTRDLVLLIEQFRPATYLRGAQNPWSLEVIAGRNDPGESYEASARREAEEEAGITLGEMIEVQRYYSSPGAASEYMVSYIGLTELGADAEGVGGLDSEAEDIRAMVVPFAALMEAVASGEAENAPLVVSALHLARLRNALRGKADQQQG